MTNECKTRRCCSLPIERINCAWRAVDSAARRGARRRVASSLCACAVAEAHKENASLEGSGAPWWVLRELADARESTVSVETQLRRRA